jgi:hypothetical protein
MRLIVCTLACTLAATGAHAQANTGPGAANLVGAAESLDFERDADGAAKRAELARDESVRESKRSPRARAAKPGEITAGSVVHDSRGAVLGTIESASMAAAVVVSAGGKVEVPLESFGRNSKGLLIDITKADFDALVKQANPN